MNRMAGASAGYVSSYEVDDPPSQPSSTKARPALPVDLVRSTKVPGSIDHAAWAWALDLGLLALLMLE